MGSSFFPLQSNPLFNCESTFVILKFSKIKKFYTKVFKAVFKTVFKTVFNTNLKHKSNADKFADIVRIKRLDNS